MFNEVDDYVYNDGKVTKRAIKKMEELKAAVFLNGELIGKENSLVGSHDYDLSDKITPDTWSWESFWGITAFLSIMLGVLNLLPIPALDGGHVMLLLYEMVSGRKPGDKFMEYAQTVGFFILIALVLFANGNDIFKAFFG